MRIRAPAFIGSQAQTHVAFIHTIVVIAGDAERTCEEAVSATDAFILINYNNSILDTLGYRPRRAHARTCWLNAVLTGKARKRASHIGEFAGRVLYYVAAAHSARLKSMPLFARNLACIALYAAVLVAIDHKLFGH